MRLSKLESRLLDLLRLHGAMSISELKEIDPRFVGAVGKLKELGLVETIRLPRETWIHLKDFDPFDFGGEV